MTPEEFVELLRPHAERVFDETGIPVEIMLAQAALETGWLGKTVRDKRTGQDSLNLFNIKGEGPTGSVTVDVVEYSKGRKVWQEAQFRAYNDYAESFSDYASL
ncbi:MAG TPA: flagellar assembly peptidoglycan hydrolase FlgJ, partial [Firmicutes bacterium]|nr:flagellar assembly peptidoglycan hydrolase FlgJ [Bacillota bacterium]